MVRNAILSSLVAATAMNTWVTHTTHGFSVVPIIPPRNLVRSLHHRDTSLQSTKVSFIDTELRGAAMKLHTRKQAPKEGQKEEQPQREPYTPTRDDYLAFLVDSQHVYQTMEDIVNGKEELASFRNTGLERVERLETDIEFLVKEYELRRPAVGTAGQEYAALLQEIDSTPEFVCHFYNHYFAHTAGGRMIGKQMSALLLEKKTLEFYKWDGDINQIKASVKETIEGMAERWTDEEKQECVSGTANAFTAGGALNSYLSRGAARS